jgi:asparagine synthase (glutamine-hydrolysing)
MPGCYVLLQHGWLTEKSFYTQPYGLSPSTDEPVADPLNAFAHELAAVKIPIVSDVPYGAFPSDGIDSSTIVALMSPHSAKPINTFSVGFQEARNSELSYAGLRRGNSPRATASFWFRPTI